MTSRLLTSAAAVVVAALAGVLVVAVLQHVAATELAAERRALLARNAELTRAALAPGSALACLEGEAGERAGDACEAAVFASAPAAAAAVAFAGERLSILEAAFDLARRGDTQAMTALAGARRAAELDRYGLVAHVLAVRDGCTAVKCPTLAIFPDARVLEANLKAQAFESYVARYASQWTKPAEPAESPPSPAAAVPKTEPQPAVAAVAPAALPAPPHDTKGTARPVDERWTFPSSESIPPVSIMNAEPALPKGAEPPAPKIDPDLARSLGDKSPGATAEKKAEKAEEPPRLPSRRPQEQAAPAPAAR